MLCVSLSLVVLSSLPNDPPRPVSRSLLCLYVRVVLFPGCGLATLSTHSCTDRVSHWSAVHTPNNEHPTNPDNSISSHPIRPVPNHPNNPDNSLSSHPIRPVPNHPNICHVGAHQWRHGTGTRRNGPRSKSRNDIDGRHGTYLYTTTHLRQTQMPLRRRKHNVMSQQKRYP
jgi:hypothetical protein